MRKQVIKFFALDYKVFMFGRVVSWTRSANVIFPLVVLCGVLTISDSALAYGLLPIALIALLLAVFFGFIYFDLKPLTESDYDYFDDVQRAMWDNHNKNIQKPIEKYNSIWALLVNPASVITLIIWYLCN